MFAGVKSVSIDVSKEQVLVESALTSAEVQVLIESTRRRAVLKGIGGSEQGEEEEEEEHSGVLLFEVIFSQEMCLLAIP